MPFRLVIAAAVAGLACVLLPVVASADVTLHPPDDTYVRVSDPTANFDEATAPENGPLSVTAEGFPLGVPEDVTYLRFDISGLSGTLTGATLRVWDYSTYGPAMEVGVYNPGTGGNDWNGGTSGLGDETDLTYNLATSPLGGTELASDFGESSAFWMTFSSGLLTSYVSSQLSGAYLITFVLRAKSTGISDVSFLEDQENTYGTGNEPELILYGLNGDQAAEVDGLVASRLWTAVRLDWRTLSEHKNAGFRVHRERSDGTAVLLTPSLVKPRHNRGELGGAEYTFVDWQAPADAAVYWIEDVDVTGYATRHGPVDAPPSPYVVSASRVARLGTLRLQAPGGSSVFADAAVAEELVR